MTAQPADAVSDVDAWEAMNSAYLAAGLAWTRERLSAGGSDRDGARWWEAGTRAEPPRPWSCWATGSVCPGSSASS